MKKLLMCVVVLAGVVAMAGCNDEPKKDSGPAKPGTTRPTTAPTR